MIRNDISSLEDLGIFNQTSLVVPPAVLAGCDPGSVRDGHDGIEHLGFAEVISLVPHEAALRLRPCRRRAERPPCR